MLGGTGWGMFQLHALGAPAASELERRRTVRESRARRAIRRLVYSKMSRPSARLKPGEGGDEMAPVRFRNNAPVALSD